LRAYVIIKFYVVLQFRAQEISAQDRKNTTSDNSRNETQHNSKYDPKGIMAAKYLVITLIAETIVLPIIGAWAIISNIVAT